ncbi:MAG: sigma-70 family RNA polymerase sigma factor [Planctomycetes bacterium]|nr:sigma-70 family RNA polymerase sigma factor [Planctomycetota bacterium]
MTTPAQEFEAIVRSHVGPLWRYLRLLGCDGARADDLAQESLLTLWRKNLLDMEPAATQAWLRKTARYLYLDTLRADQRRRETALADAADAVFSEYEGVDGGESYTAQLKACLERLAGRAREAMDLRYRAGQSNTEVAAKLDLTEDGLKTLLKRSKEALRQCLGGRFES